MKKINKIWLGIYLFILSWPLSILATGGSAPEGLKVKLANPLRVNSLEALIVAVLNLIMVLMVPVIVFFIILAGFKYVTARGNATAIGEATKALTYAVIGAVIILGAVAISQMVKNTVDEFKATPPTALNVPNIWLLTTNDFTV